MTPPTEVHDVEVDRLLAETAEELFDRHAGPDALRALAPGGWQPELWQQLEAVGLPSLEVSEELGGQGGTAAHVATVLRAAGRQLVQVPLASTAAAAWAFACAGTAPPVGPLAVVVGDGSDFEGVAHARHAAALVVVRPNRLDVYREFAVEPHVNLAGEPRDDVRVESPAMGYDVDVRAGVELRLALGRAAESAGALDAVRSLTIHHVRTRVQFGMPIARLPVVRERLALLAEEVAAAGAAVDVARLALARGNGELAVAAAKVRSAEAATRAARLAHQLHGAIGVTIEHVLQLYTRRLWAWRDEDGGERLWAERLGRALASGDAWERIVAEAAV